MKDGGPVFPFGSPQYDEDGDMIMRSYYEKGMSKRDYFAAAALQAFMRLAYSSGGGYMQYASHAKEAAACAYQLADAMLAEREKNV